MKRKTKTKEGKITRRERYTGRTRSKARQRSCNNLKLTLSLVVCGQKRRQRAYMKSEIGRATMELNMSEVAEIVETTRIVGCCEDCHATWNFGLPARTG